ncbi:hypothetical protein R1T16_16180 [Flavobacterium sp. DG1-102-2]|uniref:DUF6913 domain-containing protein n=1 Tax=Flavobacterium sp. DG1-102-2 TaxID=3081663 RepID=UPI002949465A|nr:hypothetical protein [Flavobacterium sp. DG1-102-2]MDV6169977.1 hypothetical protein [Flavobacterium sp. DG1-102-2]
MFLKFIKDFGLKKIIKKSLPGYKPATSPDAINTIGILIDESYFADKEGLITELIGMGFKRSNIETLSFKEKIKPKEIVDCCHYTRKDISVGGTFAKEDVAAFINKPFDMLISYYDIEKAPLLLATLKSKAKFKVGFSSIDNRLNSFMISSQAEKYTEFISELFKYLKILNKI